VRANPLRPWAKFARPVQIRFERCLGSATALSLQRPSPFCHPEGSREICGAPFVCPAPTGPQPPPIITESSWKHQPLLCHSGFPGVVRGTADPSASLGMTRKGQRFIKSGCSTEAFFKPNLDRSEVQPSLRDSVRHGRSNSESLAPLGFLDLELEDTRETLPDTRFRYNPNTESRSCW
jgi:hypothetical protein